MVRCVRLRAIHESPLQRYGGTSVAVWYGGWCTFAGALSDAPTTVGDKRNGYRINEGLHPRCPNPLCERRANEFRPSPFRHTYEAAKSRRLPREVFGQRREGSAWEGTSRECVSTRLFPRSGIQWRHFWFRLFRKKTESCAIFREVCSHGRIHENCARRWFSGRLHFV